MALFLNLEPPAPSRTALRPMPRAALRLGLADANPRAASAGMLASLFISRAIAEILAGGNVLSLRSISFHGPQMGRADDHLGEWNAEEMLLRYVPSLGRQVPRFHFALRAERRIQMRIVRSKSSAADHRRGIAGYRCNWNLSEWGRRKPVELCARI